MSSIAPPRHGPRVARNVAPVWPDAAMPEVEGDIVGRDEIAADLVDALRRGEPRMVLLSGLGGVGKTRLALEIAGRLAAPFNGRIAWISLGRASRDAGLSSALAAGFRLDDGQRDDLAPKLAAAVGREPVLIVLDAVEAVLHDLRLLDEIVSLNPGVRILLTGRMAFERSSLRAVAVNPLELPRPGADADAIAASPAVRLLVERAEAAGAAVAITPRTAPTIGRLVSQLDGMPLAIELAASLLRALPPHRLLERVREGLDPIVATIDWSHDQLSADDRRLYRRISVFGVPFRTRHVRTFDERSVGHGLAPLGPDVAPGLERLVRAGLLRATSDSEELDAATGPDDPRGEHVRLYELPTLIRDDAQRRLEASGEATAAMWARSNDLLALCEHVDRELAVRTRRDLLDQLDTVHDDVMAALARARAVGEGRFLLRMTAALAEYWRARGRLAEGRIWLDAALRMGPPDPSPERARALHGAGVLANWQSDFGRARAILEGALEMRLALGLRSDAAATLNQLGLIGLDQGDLATAERCCRQGLDIRRELGDEAAVASSLNTLGGVLQFGGRVEEAGAMFEESLAIRRRLGDVAGASVSLGNLGLVARDARDLAGAEAMFREAIETRERLGDRQRVAVVRHNLALVLFDAGDLDGARSELEAALDIARELGDRLETANALSDLGFVETTAGNLGRAAALQAEALVVAARIGAKGIVAQAIDGAAGVLAFRGSRCDAAILWAAADRIRRDAHYTMLEADRRRIAAETRAAREAEDEAAWLAAWEYGSSLSLDDAITRAGEALRGVEDGASTAGPARASAKVAV
jgi:predicted ATPase/Tfp pilus assembly protein PilF